MDLEEFESLLKLEKYSCGRPSCDFFSGAIGEYGESFSKYRIEKMLEIMPKVEKHFRELLK